MGLFSLVSVFFFMIFVGGRSALFILVGYLSFLWVLDVDVSTVVLLQYLQTCLFWLAADLCFFVLPGKRSFLLKNECVAVF